MLVAFAFVGIAVEIAEDDKMRIFGQSAHSALVVSQVLFVAEIVRPKANLVVVTATVTVFWSVENGRRRVAAQQVNDPPVGSTDRNIPMAFGTESQCFPFFLVIPRLTGGGVVWRVCIRHRRPGKILKGAYFVRDNFKSLTHKKRHRKLPRERPEAPAVRAVHLAIFFLGHCHRCAVVV